MSGHPQGGYDDGYGQHQGNDAYYQDQHQQGAYDEQYDYSNGHPQQAQQPQHGGEGYYDEA